MFENLNPTKLVERSAAEMYLSGTGRASPPSFSLTARFRFKIPVYY
jgi:hypothetical protein